MEFEEFDIEFLAQKLSDNPQSPLFARLADLYIGKGQVVEAVKLSEEGIKLFPNYYAGYFVLGKAHLILKEFSKANSAFEKALDLSPFNQTVAKLLKSVPNKSDDSVRTTDENYFAQPPAITEETTFEETISEAEPIQETFTPDQSPSSGVFENQFSTSSEESSGSIYAPPIVQSSVEQYQRNDQVTNSEPFPSFDEYFAQNQHRISSDAGKKLDDYLNENQSEQTATTSRDIDPAIFMNTSFETTLTESEPHFVPEPVFSSAEQAQLFAEMTRDESKPSSDLDSLTEKLQSAEKIVPQENYQPKTPVPDSTQDEQVYETDAVTPTLAEIYASQGEFRAAIQAYEILMFSQPAKAGDFQQRIRELQQLQMEKDGLV